MRSYIQIPWPLQHINNWLNKSISRSELIICVYQQNRIILICNIGNLFYCSIQLSLSTSLNKAQVQSLARKAWSRRDLIHQGWFKHNHYFKKEVWVYLVYKQPARLCCTRLEHWDARWQCLSAKTTDCFVCTCRWHDHQSGLLRIASRLAFV